MSVREQMLGAIRRGLRRGELSGEARAAAEAHLAQHPVNIVPRRSQIPRAQQIDLFEEGAKAVHATVARVATAAVAGAVIDYLAAANLPPAAVMAPDPALDRYGWKDRTMLEVRRGLPVDADRMSITGAYEEVFARLRARYGEGTRPRAVNTATGPSRTADVEQQLELGAHGPRRMHILIVRD